MLGQWGACFGCLNPSRSQGSAVPVHGGQGVLIMVRLLCQESKIGTQVVACMFLVVQCSVVHFEQMVCKPTYATVVVLISYLSKLEIVWIGLGKKHELSCAA
jgi:hypothetical protein